MGLNGMKFESWRPFAMCAVIGAVIFSLSFHLEVLNPLNVHWLLQSDWGASFVGWEAFRHDAWRLPLGAEKLLDWPAGDNIVFTDSLPALALFFKFLSPILPEPFQYIGLWFFCSVILQVYFGYRLTRKAGMDEGESLICGFLLGLTPFFLARLYHNTLFCQWMILWAFEVYGFEADEKKRRFGFGLLLVLTALTNFYLTVMVAGLFAADVLRSHVRRHFAGASAAAADGGEAKVVACLIIAMGLVGYFGVRQPDAGGFGVYASELSAWINPQTPLTSRFVPAAPVWFGAYEGFQYLGLGLIGLVLFGLGLGLRRWRRREEVPAGATRFDGAAYLAPVLVAFWAFALSDRIRLGDTVLIDLHYRALLGPITAMLRSSGRFMWPVSYGLILTGLFALANLPRRWIKPVLIAGLVLQFADLSAFLRQQWTYTEAAAAPPVFRHFRSADWDRLISAAKVVDFQPSDPQPRLEPFWELAYRAARRGVPLTDMYSARIAPAQFAFQRADEEDVKLGRLSADRLYVLADDCPPFAQASIHRLDGIMVVPPKGADLSGLTVEPVRRPDARLGAPIDFARPENRCLLGSGWRPPESGGVWSDEPWAKLYLPVPVGETGPLTLTLRVKAPSPQPLKVEVTVAGEVLTATSDPAEPETTTYWIPAARVQAGPALALTLRSTALLKGAPSSAKAPNGPDIQLVSARLQRAP